MPENSEQPAQPQTKPPFNFIIILLLIIGFISTFVSGFILSGLLHSEKPVVNATPTPIPPYISVAPSISQTANPQDSTRFLPGKFYFDDTIILVTKNTPRKIVIASATRHQTDSGYTQDTRLSMYDGNEWKRSIQSQKTADSAIISNDLIKSWMTTVDPSRVLKQATAGTLLSNGHEMTFKTSILENEISMRSLPGYTKFMSTGDALLTFDGIPLDAYVLYTRIYSSNAKDIQFYTQPIGLETDWIAFWDDEGNFYHVDTTSVKKPTDIYQTHQIAVFKTTAGAVTKTFEVEIQRSGEIPPMHYTVDLHVPISRKLSLDRTSFLNKSPGGVYTWFIGTVEGTVTTEDGHKIKGIGLAEYIKD